MCPGLGVARGSLFVVAVLTAIPVIFGRWREFLAANTASFHGLGTSELSTLMSLKGDSNP
jgi:hypothetical protein